MNMNLYHVERATDLDVKAAYFSCAEEVHQVGGALWVSLSHGSGPAFLIVALPADVSLTRFEGVHPVASVDPSTIVGLDSLFVPPQATPKTVPVVEEETPHGEQSQIAG